MLDRPIKQYLPILALFFAAAFLAGMLAPSSTRQQLTDAFQVVAENYRGLAGGKLFFIILFHNVMSSMFVLISGVLVGIIPTFATGANGFLLGVVYRQTAEVVGYWKAALKVLPHGVFEIPALLIAASYGLWLGMAVIRRMRGEESTSIRSHVGHASRQYVAVVLPLLIVAAAIETVLIVFLKNKTNENACLTSRCRDGTIRMKKILLVRDRKTIFPTLACYMNINSNWKSVLRGRG